MTLQGALRILSGPLIFGDADQIRAKNYIADLDEQLESFMVDWKSDDGVASAEDLCDFLTFHKECR